MKTFRKALKEINFELSKLMLFDIFLTTTVILLIFYLILSLLNLPRIYALSALIFFGAAAAIKLRTRKTLDVELKFDFLKEKLRTAEDNINVQNPVVDELQNEIITDLKKVDEGAFVNTKRLYIKAAAIVALCFLIILAVPLSLPNFGIDLLKKPVMDIEAADKESASGGTFSKETETLEGVVPSPENIYGEASVAKLGNRELKVTIQPAGYELNVRNVNKIEEIEFTEEFPTDVEATAAESYEEKIPAEHAELVKNYFKAIVEG